MSSSFLMDRTPYLIYWSGPGSVRLVRRLYLTDLMGRTTSTSKSWRDTSNIALHYFSAWLYNLCCFVKKVVKIGVSARRKKEMTFRPAEKGNDVLSRRRKEARSSAPGQLGAGTPLISRPPPHSFNRHGLHQVRQ